MSYRRRTDFSSANLRGVDVLKHFNDIFDYRNNATFFLVYQITERVF
jgi:hypothetical protein